MVDSRYVALFIEEARESLERMAEDLVQIEDSPDEGVRRRAVDGLFRAVHSIKGMASSLGLRPIRDQSHRLEDALDRLREGERDLGPDGFLLLGRAVSGMESMVAELASTGELRDREPGEIVEIVPPREEVELTPSDDPWALAPSRVEAVESPEEPSAEEPVLPMLEAFVDPVPLTVMTGEAAMVEPAAPVLTPQKAGAAVQLVELQLDSAGLDVAELVAEMLERLGEWADVATVQAGAEAVLQGEALVVRCSSELSRQELRSRLRRLARVRSATVTTLAASAEPERDRTRPVESVAMVRVESLTLDRQLDDLGELVIAHTVLAGMLEEQGAEHSLKLAFDRATRLLKSIHKRAVETRMLPFEWVAGRLRRVVREAAKNVGKDVSLSFRGRSLRLDRAMLDALVDPLMHLLRNAVDHGIESPEERLRLGKPAAGSIELALSAAGDLVRLEVSDDGRGLDSEELRAAAVERGLLPADEARSLSDEQALLLIAHPGFTTKQTVTTLSGRGVGVDVVRDSIQSLGGSFRLSSEPGRGLTVTLMLPPTQAVVPAFLVEANGEPYAVPVGKVKRTVPISDRDLRRTRRGWALKVGDEVVDLVPPGCLEDPEEASFDSRPRGTAMLVAETDRALAVIVDEVVERRDVVVKPLQWPLENLRQYSGSTFLGDGRIALIIEPAALTEV